MIQFPKLAGPALLALLVLWLGGCAGMPETGSAPEPATDTGEATTETGARDEPDAEQPSADTAEEAARAEQALRQQPEGFTRDTLYRLLVADLAGRQGDVATALEGYLATARETRDPRVAERATRLALYASEDELAFEAVQRWLELAPDEHQAHAIAARLYLRRGEPDGAMLHLRRLVEVTGDGTEAGLQSVAALVTRSSNPATALAAMRRLPSRYREYAVTQYAIGELADQTGDQQAALEALDRALDIDPGHGDARVLRARIWLESGEEERALADLRAARDRFPEDRALALGTARLLVSAGREQVARTTIQRTFEQFGDDSFAVYSLALMAMQISAWDDARIYLERLLAMGQRTSTAHYYLGRIAEQESDCTTAMRHYIKVGRGEHRFDSELRAADCMARLGRIEEARLHLERMGNQYDEPAAQARIATTRAAIEQAAGNPGRALTVLGNAVERYPDNLDLRYTRALTAAEQDRFELAREDLEFILDREPDNARALNALGYMLADRNLELQRARAMIERALEQNPQDPATIDSMGWVLYRQGRPAAALKHLQEAWERDPDAEIGAHLGEVLWALGRREQARAIWEQAREREPDSEILQETIDRLTR